LRISIAKISLEKTLNVVAIPVASLTLGERTHGRTATTREDFHEGVATDRRTAHPRGVTGE
jgi:hypothetical protein